MQNEELKKNASGFWKLGVFLFVLLVLLDQFVKHFAHNIFRNYVFTFSLPVPEVLIYVIYVLVLAAIIYYLSKNYKKLPRLSKVAWTLILAGAASNIFERIILGYVRDFIYITFYRWTGIYNLADFFIIAGIIILLIPS
jgi:signal peptidase II